MKIDRVAARIPGRRVTAALSCALGVLVAAAGTWGGDFADAAAASAAGSAPISSTVGTAVTPGSGSPTTAGAPEGLAVRGVSFTRVGVAAVTAPASVTVSPGAGQVSVAWTAPIGGSPVTGYRVARDGTDTNGTGPWSTTVAATTRSYTFTRLFDGTGYHLSVAAVTAAGAGPAVSLTSGTTASSWTAAGHDLSNSRSNPVERSLTRSTVRGLKLKWSHSFTVPLAATPSVVNGAVYLADTGGTLWSFDAASGAVRWSHTVSSYTGLAGDTGRATPAVADGRIIFGDKPSQVASPDGAHLIGVSAATGARLWNTVVDTQPSAVLTGAPVIDNGVAYVGVSSDQELRGSCCTFRGSVVAVNAASGAVLWKTWTAPAGYTGAAVWSSNPAIDHTTGLLYVGTGNNYTVPAGVCTTPTQTGCTPPAPDDYVDSLLALKLTTGAPAWALRTLNSDVNSHTCLSGASCGPDFDFGSDPNLFSTTIAGTPRTLVGIGQKSGIYWTVDAATGKLVWDTQVGPGGKLGGIQWGSAAGGAGIYVTEADTDHIPYRASGVSITGGSFLALDLATGAIRWQTPDPQAAVDVGYVSTAGGVVYAGSSAAAGNTMYAINSATGQILWSYPSGGTVMGGAAVVNGMVYWASGYSSGNTYQLDAFGL